MQDPTEFRKRFQLYKEGKMPYENGLPKYKNGTEGDVPAYQRFVEEMGPVLFGQIVAQGVKNPEKAYRNMITQLAYESNYGTSSVARNQNNYGGVGWNGKTYTTYKDKADFAKNYVRLMNSRYKNVIAADTLLDYAKGLKGLGYYEDSLENYSRNLTGMKSFAKALDSHIANNPDLYTVVSGRPMSQTTAAELHAASQFEPAPVVIHSDYPINNPSPSSISSWNNPTSPAFNTSELYARRATNNINNIVQDILFNDKDVSDALKDNLSKNVFGGKRLGFKNGKLPGYKDGTPTKVGEYNVYPSAVGASELNVTVPEVTVTGTDRRPMYQRYDAENSTYDPEAIRTFTDWAPVVSDIGDGLDAYNAFKNKDWSQFGIIAGAALLPNIIEKALQPVQRFVQPVAKRYISPLVDKYISPTMDRLFSKTKQLSLPSSETSQHITADDFNFDFSPSLEDSRATAVRNATEQSILDAFDSRLPYAKNTTDPIVRAVPATMENNKKLVDHYLQQIKEKYPGVSDEEAKKLFEQIHEASVDDVLHARGMTVRDPVTHEVKFVSYNNQGNKTRSAATKMHEENHTMYDLSPDRFQHPTVTALDSPLGVKKNYLNEEAGYSLPKNISNANDYDGVEEYLSADEVSSFMSEAKSLLGKTEDEALTEGDIKWFIKNHNLIGDKLQQRNVYKSIAEHITNAKKFAQWCNDYSNVVAALAIGGAASTAAALQGYANGKSPIHIKPANRGKFTALKKRTGHSASWFKENGTPAQKKMAVFALNAKKWKH